MKIATVKCVKITKKFNTIQITHRMDSTLLCSNNLPSIYVGFVVITLDNSQIFIEVLVKDDYWFELNN